MSDFDYDTVTQALQRIAIPADAAEIHDAISAMLCTQGRASKAHWLAAILPELARTVTEGDALAGETKQLLDELYNQISQQLATSEFAFNPLVPSDDHELGERAAALGHWCQGFLLGLQAGGVTNAQGLSTELGEIYQDFSEISQISSGELAADEEDEEAYAELYEYLKVGTILFYEEFQQPTPNVDVPPGLH